MPPRLQWSLPALQVPGPTGLIHPALSSWASAWLPLCTIHQQLSSQRPTSPGPKAAAILASPSVLPCVQCAC